MDELRLFVKNRLSEMTKSVIASLVGRDSILDALSVASLLLFGITIIARLSFPHVLNDQCLDGQMAYIFLIAQG